MNENRSHGLGAIQKSLQFVEDSGLVTLHETRHFLIQVIQDRNIRALFDKQLITREEAVNLLLAMLQTWLESHGIESENLKNLESPDTFHNFETFLFMDDS